MLLCSTSQEMTVVQIKYDKTALIYLSTNYLQCDANVNVDMYKKNVKTRVVNPQNHSTMSRLLEYCNKIIHNMIFKNSC